MGATLEKDLTKVMDIAYFRAVSSTGESCIVTKENMASVLAGLIDKAEFLRAYYQRMSVIIPASSVYDTGITEGGEIMVQNASSEFDISSAFLYSNTERKIISESNLVGFSSSGNKRIQVYRDSIGGSIKIRNNHSAESVVYITMMKHFI